MTRAKRILAMLCLALGLAGVIAAPAVAGDTGHGSSVIAGADGRYIP